MTKSSNDEDKIMSLCRKLCAAHAEKDAEAIVACYAPDAVIYDLAPPLGRRGMDEALVAAWLATWDGPINVDGRDIELAIRDDVAYMSALNHMTGLKTGGESVDLWFRSTLCFREINGRWLIVHEHTSTPFLMDGSMRAALDLKPEAA